MLERYSLVPLALALRHAHFPFSREALELDIVFALHGEEMDLFLHFATNSVRGLVADSRYQLLLGTSSSKGLLALNHRRAPLADLRVRRAITHAIDREAFIRTVFEGRGTVIGSHFSPSDPGYLHHAPRNPF